MTSKHMSWVFKHLTPNTDMQVVVNVCVRYVIEDHSPYRKLAKQNGPYNQKAGKAQSAVMNMDDDDDHGWSFSSFVKNDAVKDSIPDQQLGVQELTLRYPSKMYNYTGSVLQ